MKYVRRIVLFAFLAAIAALAIKGIFSDHDITTNSGRYAWSAVTVFVAGVVYFVIDILLTEDGM